MWKLIYKKNQWYNIVMNETNFQKRWAKMQRMGKAPFVFKYGIVSWGLSTGLLGSTLLQLISSGFNFSVLLSKSFYYYCITFTMMTVFFGLFWGLALWSIMKKQANNLKNKSRKHDQ